MSSDITIERASPVVFLSTPAGGSIQSKTNLYVPGFIFSLNRTSILFSSPYTVMFEEGILYSVSSPLA